MIRNSRRKNRFPTAKTGSKAWQRWMIRELARGWARVYRETKFMPDLSSHAFFKDLVVGPYPLLYSPETGETIDMDPNHGGNDQCPKKP